MNTRDVVLLLVGIAAWVAVAVGAVFAVQWDELWGFFVVLAAVLAAWEIGERLTSAHSGQER